MINLIVVLATINMPLYENDFTTRVSSDTPPGEAWAVFKYTPGSQVAHNYLRKSLDSDSNEQYTRPYSGICFLRSLILSNEVNPLNWMISFSAEVTIFFGTALTM